NTILVVYLNKQIERLPSKRELRSKKAYAFNTSSEVKEGDLLESPEYTNILQVVKVLDTSYKYYNASTGELSNSFNFTAQKEIAVLEIRDDDADIVYASKINTI